MANYDQAGNPVGGQQNAGQGQWQSGQGQQSQYAQGQPSQYGAGGRHPQGQYAGGAQQGGRGMQERGREGTQRDLQQAGRTSPGYATGLFPDLYAGFGGNPFQLISRLSDEMDRLFDSFGMGDFGPRTRGAGQGAPLQQGRQGAARELWAPRIEVCERDGKLLIQADLPGVRKEDVNVQIEDDAVILQGHRQQENTRNEQGFYHSERSYGSFYRVIPLPEGVDAEQANASYRDGVLQIELPAPQARPRGRRLEIRDAGSQQGQPGNAASTGGSNTTARHEGAQGSSERR